MTDRIAGDPQYPAPEWPEQKTDVEARDASLKVKKKKSKKVKSKETHDEPSTVFVPTRGPFCAACEQPVGWIANEHQIFVRVVSANGEEVRDFCSRECADFFVIRVLSLPLNERGKIIAEYRADCARDPYYTPRSAA